MKMQACIILRRTAHDPPPLKRANNHFLLGFI